MSVVAVAVVLALLVALLLRTKQVKAGGAAVCVLFGLVLGATPAGPAVDEALSSAGGWTWAQVQSW